MDALEDTFVNPFTDFGFKRLFGSEAHKDLIIDFLNTLLPAHHQIQELSYNKNEHFGLTPFDRKAIFDLYCQSASGERFIVEVQKAKQKFFKDRSVFYASFPIQEQAKIGDWDFRLAAVYTIGILDFTFDDEKTESEKFLHYVKLKEDETNKIFYDKLTFIYIELPKFTKTIDQLESHADKWFFAFKHLPTLHNRPRRLEERIFERFFEAAAIARFDRKEREAYEESLKHYRDLVNVTNTASEEGINQGINIGIDIGVERGLKLGLEKGLEEGLEQGLEQGRAAGLAEAYERLLASGIAPEEAKRMLQID